MSWGAQNRSKDAKTPSASRGMSEKPKLELCGIQHSRMAVVGGTCEQISALKKVLRLMGDTTGKTTERTSGIVHQLVKTRLRTMSRTLAQNHLPARTK
jgi:hypothetical protein